MPHEGAPCALGCSAPFAPQHRIALTHLRAMSGGSSSKLLRLEIESQTNEQEEMWTAEW